MPYVAIVSTPYINTLRLLKMQKTNMKTDDAVKYFGGVKGLASALEIWPHNISRWGRYVPSARAYEIEVITGGLLKAVEKSK